MPLGRFRQTRRASAEVVHISLWFMLIILVGSIHTMKKNTDPLVAASKELVWK
jgi:hypothetical protein